MKKTSANLSPGNYMEVKSVIDYLNHEICRPTLAHILMTIDYHTYNTFELYGMELYSTKDLQNIMMPDLFREMECSVTTHMVLN